MSNSRRIRRQTRPAKTDEKPQKVAVYVDELRTVEERRVELINILRSEKMRHKKMESVVVYGALESDVDDAVRDAIAIIEEHGASVTFAAP